MYNVVETNKGGCGMKFLNLISDFFKSDTPSSWKILWVIVLWLAVSLIFVALLIIIFFSKAPPKSSTEHPKNDEQQISSTKFPKNSEQQVSSTDPNSHQEDIVYVQENSTTVITSIHVETITKTSKVTSSPTASNNKLNSIDANSSEHNKK